MLWKHSSGNMSDICYDIWPNKTSKRMVTAKPQFQTLPPTPEAFQENVKRAHLQACIWKSSLSDIHLCRFGWNKDEPAKLLVPISVPSDVPTAPTGILKGVLHLWALFLKTLCIFSQNKATSDKVFYGSGQKCSKELKNHSFTSVETIFVKLQ